MVFTWKEEYLDVILVPSGLVIMFGYHLSLLYRCHTCPHTTIIGYENHNKRAWVQKMLQVDSKDRGLAISVLNNNISAANSLASISLVLSSLLGAWIGNSSNNVLTSRFIYGNTSKSILSVKHISLLSCFLLAFATFVQTTRCFVHASFLISIPNTDVPSTYIESAVIRGSNFWSLGMRALYFATTLLLWIFGPIPMFVCSVIMVVILHNLDTNSIPLHTYGDRPSHNNSYEKNGDEASCLAKTPEHPERAHENYMWVAGPQENQDL